MDISKTNKLIAKSAIQAFGGQMSVFDYFDDYNNHIDLLSSINQPCNGVTSYSTIGLYEYSIGYSIGQKPLRVEIVGACASEYEHFPNILAACAFHVINSKVSISPGIIFEGIVESYYPDIEVKHILFMPPFLWEDSLSTLDLDDKQIAWLLAVPISENENLFAKNNGAEALENLFEQEQIDIFDLERKSIL